MNTILTVAVLVLLVAGVVFAVRRASRSITDAAKDMSLLAQSGASVEATIVSAEKRRMARGAANYEYWITYAFTASDGEEYRRSHRVSPADFGDYAEGAPLGVVYLPGDPNTSAAHEMVNHVRNSSGV